MARRTNMPEKISEVMSSSQFKTDYTRYCIV